VKFYDAVEECRKGSQNSEVDFNIVGSACGQLLKDPLVMTVASECGRSNAQVLLRWSVQQHFGQSVLVDIVDNVSSSVC